MNELIRMGVWVIITCKLQLELLVQAHNHESCVLHCNVHLEKKLFSLLGYFKKENWKYIIKHAYEVIGKTVFLCVLLVCGCEVMIQKNCVDVIESQ